MVNYDICMLFDLFIWDKYYFNIVQTEKRAEECGHRVCELENQTETGYLTLGK